MTAPNKINPAKPYVSTAYDAGRAFDPTASVFVSANAGAGKTSLLTNRVLALLLHGVSPSRVLCLTYTHAAASEMANRILEKLGRWVMEGDGDLQAQLAQLTGKPAGSQQLIFARSLFARVLEAPQGLRIQTIHSFCQSLLRQFPLEAAISPHFSLMDARSEQELLNEARLRLFARAQERDPVLQRSLNALAHALSESGFHELLAEIIKNKRRIRSLFAGIDGPRKAEAALWKLLNIPHGSTITSLAESAFIHDDEKRIRLEAICAQLLSSAAASDRKTGQGLDAMLRGGGLRDYSRIYLTAEGEKLKKLFTQKTLTDPATIALLLDEQEHAFAFAGRCNALETAQRSTHILIVSQALLALYDAMKNHKALMDYDDLILTARSLLQKPGIAPWVLYKLDGGIDHVLVDEAQDTAPEQWDIIEALTQEFFAGDGAKEQDRALFIVGDEKQSIYSFQGADPLALSRKEKLFSRRIDDAGKRLHKIQLLHSFRSTPEILSAVDAIFAHAPARSGLMFGDAALEHIPTRTPRGCVELWPLTASLEENGESILSSKTRLARQIADTLRQWIDAGNCAAGDIMILVRKRTVLVDCLVRALKRKNIPVAGHDRMALGENLAVQDLIALGECLLLPEDDLTLAALLKSPLFGIGESALFALTYNRGDRSLWERLREQGGEHFETLSDLRARADFTPPYELFSYLLETCGGRKRITGRMGDEYNEAIDEFLGQALLYERSHTPSLQGFLHWLTAGDGEIKRDMEQARDCVRIMTVHGAKGLQAPVVILPDTVDVPKSLDTLLWYEGESGAIPLWPASAKRDDDASASSREDKKGAMLAEYRRLLYVALTRAENRLYICGAASKNALSEHSWYHLAATGLAPLATPFDTGTQQGYRLGEAPLPNPPPHRAGEGTASPSPAQRGRAGVGGFGFLHTPPPPEPTPSHPLVPSRQTQDEPAASSPKDASVFLRGKLIHHLLQYLPQAAPPQRERIIHNLAAQYRHGVSPAIVEACVTEALRVIDHPEYGFLFSGDALSEVPVAGSVLLKGESVAVAGQIDRLHIGEREIWIVDYKSNRLPPATVPGAYIRQMALYRLLLQRIYPEKTVKCALLWTATAAITHLDEGLMSSYI